MKKSVLLAALLTVVSIQAHAVGPALLWGCNLSARVQGTDFAFIIRGTDMIGEGVIKCRSVTGKIYRSPIVMRMTGIGIGAQIALPTNTPACLQIYNANIGVAHPSAMYGQFRLAPEVNVQAGAVQLAAGAGVAATVKNGGGVQGQVHLKAQCNSSVGLGIGVNANVLHIMTPNQARDLGYMSPRQRARAMAKPNRNYAVYGQDYSGYNHPSYIEYATMR